MAVSVPGETLLAFGYDHVGAITSSGLFMWGANGSGQLGDGMAKSVSAPENVMFSNASALSLGATSSCMLTTSGKLSCSGSNAQGQLGNGTMNPSSTPVPVVWP